MKRGIDYTGVGVAALISNKNGEFLMGKRGAKARNEKGKWEFPGGSIEFGERLKEAVVREIKEELGVDIEPENLLPAIDHLIPDEGQHWVAHAIFAKIVNGKPRILEPEKCDEIGWFKIDEIEKLDATLAVKSFLPLIREHLRYKS